MKLLITGATGYIGERLVQHALSLGHNIIAASRQPLGSQVAWLPFDLSNADISLPDGVDVVFHLAATTTSSLIDPELELTAAQHLIKSAEKVGAKIIFVSSQTARENAPTAYGRTKWQIERLVLVAGGWVIRPGQVYGGYERALFGVLVNVLRRLPVIPAFLPAPKIQAIHVDDLVAALLNCAESNIIPASVLYVGATKPVSFTDFLRTIARVRVRRYRLAIPVPVFLVRLASTLSGGEFGLDRLVSLFDLPAMDTERDLHLLGVTLRPLSSGMTRSGNGRRRGLIREGHALLAYVLKAKPTLTLVRRYVRGIERVRGGQPLYLPEFVLRLPVAIALLDNVVPAGSDFSWRLDAAVMLAEASVQGARRFLAIGETSGFVISLIRMTYAVTLELWWRILSLVIRPFLRPVLCNLGVL
jgi:uncharacterized protein YbjT (DUF2867 family)